MKTRAVDFKNKYALEAALLHLKTELLVNGIEPVDPAAFTVERFTNLPIENQTEILANITAYLKVLSEDISPARSRGDYEVERLKVALRSFNLKLVDEDFFNKIGEEDFIELYDERNIQIYRSVKFFNLCSYSVLDLSVNSWDELYHKPSSAMSELMNYLHRTKTERQSILCTMGSFVQREKFAYANQEKLRTFLVNFKYFTPLENIETGEPGGFLSLFTAKVLAQGEDSSRFGVL